MQAKRLPPVWIMGLLQSPLGIAGAIGYLTLPQLLAAQHVPETEISKITGLGLVPTFTVFLLAPILDLWLKRRTYVAIFNGVAGLFAGLTLLDYRHPEWLGVLLMMTLFGTGMSTTATGGWLGSVVPKDDESKLSAWMIVSSIGGFGLTSIFAIGLFRALPTPLGAVALGALVSISSLILPFIPCPPPDQKLMSESFRQFGGDLLTLVRRPVVLWTILLFVVPAGAFALTNTLGGLGRDYKASEQFVALVGGLGTAVAGVVGSLIVPPLAAKFSPRPLYLGIGAVGAAFTLLMIVLPRVPLVFLIALMGENVFQSAAFALGVAITFRTIGKDNPLAATQFALLQSSVALPVFYMQILDGQAYGKGGLLGMFALDAGLGLAACAAMTLIVTRLTRRGRPGEDLTA